MKTTYVLKREPITLGMRLDELINENYDSQYMFTKKFNEFLVEKQKDGLYTDQPILKKEHVSRWVRDRVKMGEAKIRMFADFFGVDYEYLACKQYDKHKPDTLPISKEDIRERENFDSMINFLELNGYKVEISCIADVHSPVDIQKCIVDGYICEAVVTFESVPESFDITFPDKKVVRISADIFEKFVKDTIKYIKFSLNEICDSSNQETD